MNARLAPLLLAVVLPPLLAPGCSRPPSTASSGQPHKHEHHPPHGGTPVVLGDEAYHIELVLDASAGTLQAFVLDGELENFIRSAASGRWQRRPSATEGARFYSGFHSAFYSGRVSFSFLSMFHRDTPRKLGLAATGRHSGCGKRINSSTVSLRISPGSQPEGPVW